MTGLSPLNANLVKDDKLNAIRKQDKHERVYKNLIAESVVVKPNKAKATLINETFPKSAISAIKDFINDGKNLFKATATGKMDDNSLGRINDFGMKLGGLVIASYLATNKAKTKTQAIAQYVGGGAFFASMALWPKIFINLPARLVHGFRIDQRYLSAQGEKKDFFLDNQFLPWDAFSQDELRKNAKKAGIDYDGENGDEKIKRKMQKTALQNRTLWMATAGFATPLMTSIFGDWFEPKIKKSVINNGYQNAINAQNAIDEVLGKAKSIVRNNEEIDNIFKKYKHGTFDSKEMLDALSEQLSFDMREVFNSEDDIKTVKNLKFNVEVNQLKELRNETAIIDIEDLDEILAKIFPATPKDSASKFTDELEKYLKGVQDITENKTVNSGIINNITEEFKRAKNKNFNTLSQIVHNNLKGILSEDKINAQLQKADFKYDDTEFFKQVKEYNTNVLGAARGRLKEFLEAILNPVVGSRDESYFTGVYREAMDKVLPKKDVKFRFPIYDKETKKMLKTIACSKIEKVRRYGRGVQPVDTAIETLSLMFQDIAARNDDEYQAELERMLVPNKEGLKQYLKDVTDDKNLNKITEVEAGFKALKEEDYAGKTSELVRKIKENIVPDKSPLDKATRELQNWISKNIKSFINIAEVNNNAIRAKGLICANVEKRILNGDFRSELIDRGMLTDDFPLEEWIEKAKYMIYKGTVASDACTLEIKNENLYKELRDIVFNPKYYKKEMACMEELEDILNGIKNLKTSAKDNALVSGLANLLKPFATETLNNQEWKKRALPLSLALVGITLLVQPLFGNIKKDFPQDTKGGKN